MARSVTAIEVIVDDLIKIINKDLYLGALNDSNITDEICFDCNLWNNGYNDSLGAVVIPPIKDSVLELLDDIITFLSDELANTAITDYGFKTQLERYLTVVKDLRNKINSIQCNETCSDVALTAQLLATLVMTLSQILGILEAVNGLLAYIGMCGCVGTKLFDILMGKFINGISDLQCLMQDWYGIVMTFFQYSAMPAKSYVASYMPRQPITPPPMPGPMQHACVPAPPRPMCPCPPQPCPPTNGCNSINWM